jgi:hypothetical protein
MRRILRCAFVALLSLALSATGATLGLAHMTAHADPGSPGHRAAAHAEHQPHAHHGMAPALSDDGVHKTGGHSSKNCCSACTVVSPLPQSPGASIELIGSAAVYSSLRRFDCSVAVFIDPGIPKRIG